MNTKSDLSWRIGMIMLVLCATLIVAVLPAAADYDADKPLVEVQNGTVTGGMNGTIGDSYYSPKMWSDEDYTYSVTLPDIVPANATEIVAARLYVYWTWSFNDTNSASSSHDTGVAPEMEVKFSSPSAPNSYPSLDEHYIDCKNDDTLGTETTSYNYPSGTYAYNVKDYLDAGNHGSCTVDITNIYNDEHENAHQSFNIQTVKLMVWYNVSGSNATYHYWIDEGCDMTYVYWSNSLNNWSTSGVKPSEAMAWANFSQVDFTYNASNATLVTVVPAGGSPKGDPVAYNKLLFSGPNGNEWNNTWPESPAPLYDNFSCNITDVSYYFNPNSINYALICNGWNDSIPSYESQMEASGAFLLVKDE